MKPIQNVIFHPALIACTRIFLGLLFFTSGMGKLTHGHFPGIMGPVWLEDELAKYELGFFARFIAYFQVLIGGMMLVKRFSLIGSILLMPMLINILVVTISLKWRGTPYVVLVFLLMNCYLLITDWSRIKFLFAESDDRALRSRIKRKNLKGDFIWGVGLVFLFAAPLIYNLNHLATFLVCSFGLLIVIMSTRIN